MMHNYMEAFLKGMSIGMFVILMVLAMVFFVVVVSPAIGYIAGSIVGWVFSETCTYWLAYFGIEASMGQVGAMLAFVGSFFKSFNTTSEKK